MRLILYRGDLADTAALVGLKNINAEISEICFSGKSDFCTRRYLDILNKWLIENKMPEISYVKFSTNRGKGMTSSLLANWGWGKEECAMAVKLSGLPLPLAQ